MGAHLLLGWGLLGALEAAVGLVLLLNLWLRLFIGALRGAFASEVDLLDMAGWIGSSNPMLARIVCWLSLVVLVGIAVLTVALAVSSELRRATGAFR